MLALRVVFGMSILLLTAGLAVRLAGRRWSAGERHAVWTVALALSLLLPILLRFEPPVTAGACGWTAERSGRVLTQELAHLRRRDLWWRLAGPLGGPGRGRGDEGRGAGHGGGDSGSESGVEGRVGVYV